MMLRVALAVLVTGVMASLSSLSFAQGTQQLQPCLHGPSEQADQRTRREAALSTAQQINRAEHRGTPLGRISYRSFERLGVPAPPSGFRLQLNIDSTTYTFSLKDTRDPCGYAIFSDQDEWIYAATPEARVQIARTQP